MKEEYLITITHNRKTLNARCESETQARYLISLICDPCKPPEDVKLHRVRGLKIVGHMLLHLGAAE